MKCFDCGTKNKKKAVFCRHCGHRLTSFCPACGVRLRHPANFCDRCGHTLGQELTAFRSEGSHLPEAGSKVSPGPQVYQTQTQPAIPDNYQRFIPKEFAEKLQTARTSGDMAGERRVVTMLFCDLKGSTAAAGELDPEEWTEIINGAFEQMIRPVYKYEGTVARLMGDGILAFFGAPIAHEDDPQRAILAGLDIISASKFYRDSVSQRYDIDLDVRVGINTGEVVVGAVGSDLRMEYTAMGDAINLAARMEQTASPGTVQISGETHKLVGPLFEFEDLGGIQVKGKPEPVPAYRVLRRKSDPGRLRGIEGLEAPLIGRESEWSDLLGATEALQRGVGQIIFLVGEAGLGKSRLIRELFNMVAHDKDGPLAWYETTSLSYEAAQPYGLFQRLARRLCGISANDSPATVRDKLEAMALELPAADQIGARRVFETLFGLPNAGGLPPLEGESFKGQLAVVNESLWRFQASSRPVVLVFDDLHWTDPASISLLESLLSLSEEVPILFLCAMRPDRTAPGWGLRHSASETFAHRFAEYIIRPLSAEDSYLLIDSLLTISDLPQVLRQNIMAKAEGNPFFVEEVVRALIDSGDVARDESGIHWLAAGDGSTIDVPDNLQALLVTRIDKLEDETRRVLQLASLIGRSFHFRVLERVLDGGLFASPDGFAKGQLSNHLTKLQYADLIREATRIPELEYMFRHALTQEAAYRTILHKLRRDYHGRVGEVMEQLFADQLEEHAPMLAHHFQEAEDTPRAIRYHTMAGDAAYRLYALTQAIEHYGRALALSDLLTADGQELLHLYKRRGRALELDNAYADALENYAEMERLAAERNDQNLKLAALLARTIVHSTFTTVFDPKIGLPLAEEAIVLARQLGDRAAETKVLWSLMLVHFFSLADSDAAIQYGQEALELARKHELGGQLPFILNDLGRIMGFTGWLKEGRPLVEESIGLFEEVGNLPLHQDSLNSSALLAYYAGDFPEALDKAQEGLRVSRSINNQWGIDSHKGNLAMVYIEQGDYGRALENLRYDVEEVRDLIVTLPETTRIYVELGAASLIAERLDEVQERDYAIGPVFNKMFQASIVRAYVHKGDLIAAEQLWPQLELNVESERPEPINQEAMMAYLELYFAQGQNDQVVTHLKRLIGQRQEMGFLGHMGELYLMQARALLALDPPRTAKARAALEQGLRLTREQGANRTLWKILLALADLSTAGEAVLMRQEALEIVTWIAGNIDDQQLRDSFLNLAQVRSLMASRQSFNNK